jgi:hypothetical protein
MNNSSNGYVQWRFVLHAVYGFRFDASKVQCAQDVDGFHGRIGFEDLSNSSSHLSNHTCLVVSHAGCFSG